MAASAAWAQKLKKSQPGPSVPLVQKRGNRVSVVDYDELVIIAQEPGKCLCCHGQVKAVYDGRSVQ
jgi:hypothetical protein